MMKVEIRVAWGEMDAYGHVNNAVFLRWLETARIDWFGVVDFPEEKGVNGPVVDATETDEAVDALAFWDTGTWPDRDFPSSPAPTSEA